MCETTRTIIPMKKTNRIIFLPIICYLPRIDFGGKLGDMIGWAHGLPTPVTFFYERNTNPSLSYTMKLEIKRIEDKSARQVTFTKRRNGLIKKAKELAVLCEVDVNVIIFSSRGKFYHYCSSNSLAEILRRYHSRVEAEPSASAGVCETQEYSSNYASFLSSGELLQIVERDLREPHVDNLSITDLMHLEEQLQAALITARSTKTHLMLQSVTSLHEKEKKLTEDNRLLEEKIAGNRINMGANEITDLNNIAPGRQLVSGDKQHALLDLLKSN